MAALGARWTTPIPPGKLPPEGHVMTNNRRGTVSVAAVPSPALWHREADIVVIGSGAAGMPAAIFAREAGASVILIEAEPDIGGHAITSGGNVPLGGGTSAQKAAGIDDSPDLVFLDNTDWSVVQPNGFPDYRYNDRELVRAFADENVAAYDWLLAHGVVFADKAPDSFGGTSIGNSVPREMHAVPMHWIIAQTGEPEPATTAATRSTGNGLMRPLEAAARKVGVEILLEHRMTAIHREFPGAGRVTGHSGCAQRQRSRHPGTQGGDHRDWRPYRQRRIPPPVRPTPDLGILRPRGHALVRSGCVR